MKAWLCIYVRNDVLAHHEYYIEPLILWIDFHLLVIKMIFYR